MLLYIKQNKNEYSQFGKKKQRNALSLKFNALYVRFPLTFEKICGGVIF